MLDLGCGTGKQTHKISNLIGKKGKVCAVDLSKESIKKLSEKSKNTNVNAIVDSFDNIDTILNKLRLKKPLFNQYYFAQNDHLFIKR